MANLTVDLANILTSTGVKASYGDPVELEGTTIIPVASSWFGFGGGQGLEDDESDSAMNGGGGGGASVPLGAYVKQGDSLEFQPNPIVLLCVAVPFVWVAGRAVARIVRALKR
ncbi:hypothetical protein GCM10022198_19090 [Klugiella xanthotipulae]|uniref:Sporulation protein YtfJ n=1 Tax=Klugiella xanthotipulae TaxID=244735 RepID=A0A543HS57_9MICO|nr:spore germination protein GerW family protein [Klugiella xanthotipulae]TQM61109.1 sporulation protein YtfJ [Klugiella xanthotipulae]